MTFQEKFKLGRRELIEASDAVIDDAIEHVDPIVLRGLLYLLTGDEEVAALPHTAISMGVLGDASAITDPHHVGLLRAKGAAFLKSYREAGAGDYPIAVERLHRSLELAAGDGVPEAELEMWIEQLAIDPMVRGYEWPASPAPERRDGFQVVVIGSGMGGLNAAVHLKRAGIPFTLIEKNADVGGTWHENRYPGARLDTTSRSYFHSFGVDFPCPAPYSVQAHNQRYMTWVANEFDLYGDIEFDTEVDSVVWDDATQVWEITARGPDGARVWRANAVISAVGFLNRPNIPDFPGCESFAGPKLHSSKWPEGYDIAGKRVGVIGSGATSYQLVPELAKQAGHLTLFQREASWCFEAPDYLRPYEPQVNWLDRNMPYLTNFLRFRASWLFRADVSLPRITIDPEFDDPHAVSPVNKFMRERCLAFIERKLEGRSELIEKMIPRSPPFSSRPVLVGSDDNIYDALMRENVALVTEGIDRITPAGIRTVDGREHELDIIVFATGFRPNDFLWPMDVRGRNGTTCETLWAKDGARAYLGVMLPDFPNFFMLYGPNTNAFGNGLGVIETQEFATRFALSCIGELILKGQSAVEVGKDAYDRFNAALDREEAKRVYSDRRTTSYYRNEHRRSACNCPFDIRLLWRWMRDPAQGAHADPADPDPAVRAWIGADLQASG